MFGTILLAVAFVVVAACVGVSLLRGFSKSVMRGAAVLFSAVASLITSLSMKSVLSEVILDMLMSDGGTDISELNSVSPTLVEVLTQLVGALTAPIAFVLFFFVYWFIAGIACLIVGLVLRKKMKAWNGKIPMSRLWGAAIGLVEGFIIVGVLFLPVAGYMSVIRPAMEGLVEQGIMEDVNETEELMDILVDLDEAPVLKVHRVLGGQLVADSLMSVKVNGENVSIREEIPPVMGMIITVSDLGETDMANYNDRQVELMHALGDSLGDSKLLAAVVGDILYGATDAWLDGETFMDVEKPGMGGDDALLNPFMDILLEIIHDDAKTPELLEKDIHTFADVMGIFVEKDVISNMGDSEQMAKVLGGNGVAKAIIDVLEQNESMEPLIPEVMNLGLRAISRVLVVPENADEQYGEFMDDVASALNDVAALSKEERTRVLTEQLSNAFNKAEVTIDSEILEYYADDILTELVDNGNGEVTEADVKAYFDEHAADVKA